MDPYDDARAELHELRRALNRIAGMLPTASRATARAIREADEGLCRVGRAVERDREARVGAELAAA